MTNEQIINDIKSRLTGEKETDIAYLQTEMQIYRSFQNEEVIYAIANMMFGYMDKSVKERLDLKTHAILDERRELYEQVVGLLNDGKLNEAKAILISLIDVYEKATYTSEMNYYDFDQMIEYFIFCETVEKGRRLKVKRYPEPVTYYTYQLASIYLEESDLENAKNTLKIGLKYNPRCIYIMQQLVLVYKELNDLESYFNTLIDILNYGYTKEQLSFAYTHLAYYFEQIAQIDALDACIELSKTLDFSNKNDYVLCLSKYKVPCQVSSTVIKAMDDFIEYSIKIKDLSTAGYIAICAHELTDNEKYLSILEILNKENK